MGITENALTFKGTSSGSFPFDIAIVENDGINVINDNSTLREYRYRSGASKRRNHNRGPIRKRFLIEVMTAEQRELDLVKQWLNGEGWLESYDNPGRMWWVYQVDAYKAKISEVNTYEIEVEFLCHPYAMSKTEKEAGRINDKLRFDHQGTAEVYPTFSFQASSDLRMFAVAHPNGRALQIGYDNGPVVIPSGARVTINTTDNTIYVNQVRKYFTPASRIFAIEPGVTEIGITVNTGGRLPVVIGKFREAYL
ncbi:phage tail family protein [Aerococcaceae bacterium NML160702]|nr:phage tail family protein [Aerococcaceae bacterium NML190073]MCW6681544.1 phage tail family protein [Aerococcaceae bacterium NML160702]